MKYLRKYNESWAPDSDDITRVFKLEFEHIDQFDVSYYDITSLEHWQHEGETMFNVTLELDFSENEGVEPNTTSENIIKPIFDKLSRKYDFQIIDWLVETTAEMYTVVVTFNMIVNDISIFK